MRFKFDSQKSAEVKRKRGIDLDDVQEIFDQAYILDRKCDAPEQYRAIGWCGAGLYSVVFEIRHDATGEYYHLVTAWKSTKQEESYYGENI